MDSEVREEIEALQAIYGDELSVTETGDPGNPSGAILSIDLYPSTGDVKEEQLIKLTLELEVDSTYPKQKPAVRFKNSRGLSDESIKEIRNQCEARLNSQLGQLVLYEVVHVVTEALTEKNVPNGHCCICLEGFDQAPPSAPGAGSCVVRTNCFHHLHAPCLRRFVTATARTIREEREEWARLNPYDHMSVTKAKTELCCPVCREKLPEAYQTLPDYLDSALTLSDNGDADADGDADFLMLKYVPDEKTKRYWEDMEKVYAKQLAQGGIIDPDEEENRRLIVLSSSGASNVIEVRRAPPPGMATADKPVQKPPKAASASNSSSHGQGKSHDNKGGHRRRRGGHGHGHKHSKNP